MALESDLGDIELLLAELKAIEVWDDGYWRNRNPNACETIAFMGRKKRRSQIIRQMVAMRRSRIMPVTDS